MTVRRAGVCHAAADNRCNVCDSHANIIDRQSEPPGSPERPAQMIGPFERGPATAPKRRRHRSECAGRRRLQTFDAREEQREMHVDVKG